MRTPKNKQNAEGDSCLHTRLYIFSTAQTLLMQPITNYASHVSMESCGHRFVSLLLKKHWNIEDHFSTESHNHRTTIYLHSPWEKKLPVFLPHHLTHVANNHTNRSFSDIHHHHYAPPVSLEPIQSNPIHITRPSLVKISADQGYIGWFAFLQGFLATAMITQQIQYFVMVGSQGSSTKWGSDLCKEFWNIVKRFWDQKNALIHRAPDKVEPVLCKVLEEAIQDKLDRGPTELEDHLIGLYSLKSIPVYHSHIYGQHLDFYRWPIKQTSLWIETSTP